MYMYVYTHAYIIHMYVHTYLGALKAVERSRTRKTPPQMTLLTRSIGVSRMFSTRCAT